MRGEQLAKIAEDAIGSTAKISYSPTGTNFKNSTLFLTKWAIKALSPGELIALKKKNNLLIYDPVDSAPEKKKVVYADAIVAASRGAYTKYSRTFPKTAVILFNHHVDPRVGQLDFSKRPKAFRAGYFGELVNTLITAQIKKDVDFIEVSTAEQSDKWFKKLPVYNMHYAVRQNQKNFPNKPFLKGFTAAHCNSNILIQDSEKEAIRWLGKDYPYLIKGKASEEKVLNMIKYAKKSYGTKEWERGLKIMQTIKEKTSEDAIGQQLIKLFDKVGG